MEEDDPSHTLRNAHSHFHKNNFKQAEELYSHFISRCLQSRNCEASDLATAFNNRGQIRYLRVDFTEAVEDYTCAIQAQGQFEIPYYNRGLIHYRLGFYEQAKKDFEQTLKLNPDFEEAKVSLSQTLLDQHQKEGRGS
ncbi:tetratricopeptide repeat protein 32 isoform X1 [Eucyclogobius newberryi]|uniref:tetratricopeptide repeat protein 32 isoform X1 n=1 Tax=Eucyclogobius newberryi TaxID=166745 RepID=UPI003B5B8D39